MYVFEDPEPNGEVEQDLMFDDGAGLPDLTCTC